MASWRHSYSPFCCTVSWRPGLANSSTDVLGHLRTGLAGRTLLIHTLQRGGRDDRQGFIQIGRGSIAGCEGVSTSRAQKIVRNAGDLAAQLIRRRTRRHHAQGSRGIVQDTRCRSTFVISITHVDVRMNFAIAPRPRIGQTSAADGARS